MIIQRKIFVGVILTLLIISVFLPNLNNSLIRFDQLTIYVIFIGNIIVTLIKCVRKQIKLTAATFASGILQSMLKTKSRIALMTENTRVHLIILCR